MSIFVSLVEQHSLSLPLLRQGIFGYGKRIAKGIALAAARWVRVRELAMSFIVKLSRALEAHAGD